MISFDDPSLYVKGTCNVVITDPDTGDIAFQSGKVQTAAVNTSADAGTVRAGLGNGIAIQIASDADVGLTLTAANFDMALKGIQTGTEPFYGAPTPVCEVITADSETLTVSADAVSPLGHTGTIAYVTKSSDAGLMAVAGKAKYINESGEIEGFTAEEGESYLVHYWALNETTRQMTIYGLFMPKVYHVTIQIAVYSMESTGQWRGHRVGWLYITIPRMQFSGDMRLTGDQSTADATEVSGTALTYIQAAEESTWEKADDISGSDTNSITFTISEDTLAYAYYCLITDEDGNTVKTDVVHAEESVGTSPEIVTQPTDYTGSVGDTASFTVKATGDGLTYQWYWRAQGTTTWKATTVTGNKTDTITFNITESRLTYEYYCLITDENENSVESNTVKPIESTGAAIEVVQQPVSYTGEIGDTATFTAEVAGTDLTYQWYRHLIHSGACADADLNHLAYMVYVPSTSPTETVTGLLLIGGSMNVKTGSSAQISVKYLMSDGTLETPDYSALTFTTSGDEPDGTSVDETGIITTGDEEGSFTVTVSVTDDESISVIVPVTVYNQGRDLIINSSTIDHDYDIVVNGAYVIEPMAVMRINGYIIPTVE